MVQRNPVRLNQSLCERGSFDLSIISQAFFLSALWRGCTTFISFWNNMRTSKFHEFIYFLIIFLSSPKNIFFHCFQRGRERGKERKRCEREAPVNWFPQAPRLRIPCTCSRDGTHNPGLHPDQETNLQPFGHRMTLNNLSHAGSG